MSTRRSRNDDVVRADAVVAAEPAFVVEALSNAALLPRWWAAGWQGCTLAVVNIEPWPGGVFRIEASEPRGAPSLICGELVALTRQRLRVTWKVGRDAQAPASLLTIRLRATEGSQTRVEVEQEGVAAELRTRAHAFWRRVLGVMSAGIPRLAEMQASPLSPAGDTLDDAAAIATQIARLAPSLLKVLGAAAADNARAVQRVGSPRYAGGGGEALARLATEVSGRVQALFDSVDVELIPPSLGFGSRPEVRVSPNVGASDLPGGRAKVGVQIDVNPRGEDRRPIGRFNADVHVDDSGRAVGATVGWQCRF